MHHPTDRIAYTTAFVAPVVEHWLEREIVLLVCQNMISRKGPVRLPVGANHTTCIYVQQKRTNVYDVVFVLTSKILKYKLIQNFLHHGSIQPFVNLIVCNL